MIHNDNVSRSFKAEHNAPFMLLFSITIIWRNNLPYGIFII